MKKKIIIIITAVIIAAGLGTGSFFGIRSALNPENVKNDVTTTEQNATPQNTDDENDTVTEGKPKTTAAKKSTQKGNGKLLTANDYDFEILANILNYARLTGYVSGDDNDKEVYNYPEYDCTKEDACSIIPGSNKEPQAYLYLFGASTYEKNFRDSDPLNRVEKSDFLGYHKMDAENVRIMVEEVFNLDFDKVMNTGSVKDVAYLNNGFCYCIVGRDGCDDRTTEASYNEDKQKKDGSYEVTFDIITREDQYRDYEKYGKIKVECSLKDYNGMRLWSITKVGKA